MKITTLALVLALSACSEGARDPVEPPEVVDLCPGCGPADLYIESFEVALPASDQVIRSGDTINVRVVIRNMGEMAADTTTAVGIGMSTPAGSLSGYVRVGRVARDSTTTIDVKVVAPLIPSAGQSYTTIMRSFSITVHANDVNHTNNRVTTAQYRYEPNIVRVSGPDSIRAGVAYPFAFEVVNLSRHEIPATTISSCLMYFGCKTPVMRFAMPAVAPGTTATMPFTFRVIPDPELPPMPQRPSVAACYGQAGFGSLCSYKEVAFMP
jgi:hypothetical protein